MDLPILEPATVATTSISEEDFIATYNVFGDDATRDKLQGVWNLLVANDQKPASDKKLDNCVLEFAAIFLVTFQAIRWVYASMNAYGTWYFFYILFSGLFSLGALGLAGYCSFLSMKTLNIRKYVCEIFETSFFAVTFSHAISLADRAQQLKVVRAQFRVYMVMSIVLFLLSMIIGIVAVFAEPEKETEMMRAFINTMSSASLTIQIMSLIMSIRVRDWRCIL
jgi:hypothetical protein